MYCICLSGDAEYRATTEACCTGEIGCYFVYQQDRPSNAGAETAADRRVSQTEEHCGGSQWAGQVWQKNGRM